MCQVNLSLSYLGNGSKRTDAFPRSILWLLVNVCVMPKKREGAGPRGRMSLLICAWVMGGISSSETKPGDFPGGTVVKNPPANAGDTGSIPGPGRSTCRGATKPVCHSY